MKADKKVTRFTRLEGFMNSVGQDKHTYVLVTGNKAAIGGSEANLALLRQLDEINKRYVAEIEQAGDEKGVKIFMKTFFKLN